jgi:DNA-binding NtrC family response regulator
LEIMVASEEEQVEDAPDQGRPVVVCVDDERPILAALARALRNEPYRVVTTDSAEEALDWIRSDSVQLILADYRMSGISGTSLLQMVKAASPSTIRVLLTGYPEDAWIRAAAENGLMQVWTKPWDDQSLRSWVRDLLRERPDAPSGGRSS